MQFAQRTGRLQDRINGTLRQKIGRPQWKHSYGRNHVSEQQERLILDKHRSSTWYTSGCNQFLRLILPHFRCEESGAARGHDFELVAGSARTLLFQVLVLECDVPRSQGFVRSTENRWSSKTRWHDAAHDGSFYGIFRSQTGILQTSSDLAGNTRTY